MDSLGVLTARLTAGLLGDPEADQTIQDGVDLAERDLSRYITATTSEQRIHIGLRQKERGMKPAVLRPRANWPALIRRTEELAAEWDVPREPSEFSIRVLEERGMQDR